MLTAMPNLGNPETLSSVQYLACNRRPTNVKLAELLVDW